MVNRFDFDEHGALPSPDGRFVPFTDYDALLLAARKVTCRRCWGFGFIGGNDDGTGIPCPDCADLRRILEEVSGAQNKRRGRLTCPCGFVGGSRNIRQHRINCPAWQNSCTTDAAREG